MPSFEENHFLLLDLATILEPQSSYQFDYTFTSILEELLCEEKWDNYHDGDTPEEEIDDTPWSWYTQYWFNCVFLRQCANLNGLEFPEICDYEFYDNETIYTRHFLDLY